mmetsp:Transcript_12679/g.14546  ORF Transcript_12679/g.14546 Transcript_12679/m.14546 type:complete len:296 (+) Transcript_12679:88-975(+)
MEDIYADLPPPKGTASVAPLVGAGVKRKRSLQDPGGDEKKPLLHEQTNPVSKAEEESRPQNDSKEDLTTDGIVRKLTKVLKETKKEKKQIKAISLLTTLLSSDADLEKNSKDILILVRLVGRIVRERSEQKLKRSPECTKAFQNLYAAAGNRFETSLSGDDQESIRLFQLCLKTDESDESFSFSRCTKQILKHLIQIFSDSSSNHAETPARRALCCGMVSCLNSAVKKYTSHEWAKEPVDRLFKVVQKNLNYFPAEDLVAVKDLIQAMTKHRSNQASVPVNVGGFDAHPLRNRKS